MALETVREVLGWCTLINMGVLLWWFGWLAFARDLVYRLHSRWFTIPSEHFDTVHYAAMASFKLLVLVLNLVPYLALHIVG